MDLPVLDTVDRIAAATHGLPAPAALTEMVLGLLQTVEQALPKIMMLWSQRRLFVAGPSPDSPPLQILGALTRHLEREMRRGRLRRGNAEVVARLVMGACWNYVMLRIITAEHAPIPKDIYARTVVDHLWKGLAPDRPAADRRARKKRASSPKATRPRRR
jgi:hypothetical protein